MRWWALLRDMALTGTAIFVVISQVSAKQPSDVLLATAIALTAPSIADHARALLSGHGGGQSSPSQQESSSSASSSQQ